MKALPIVGGFYRPPAKAILACLGAGAKLILRPEPQNPYDPHAIAVWVATASIPRAAHEELDRQAQPFGWSLETILEQAEIHLGYVPKVEAAQIRLKGDTEGQMTFAADGKPLVRFEI